MKLAWVAIGGALGAVLRYGMVMGVHRVLGAGFPWGTLTVNAVGSLAIGILWAFAERTPFSVAASAFLFVGVLGAFTTFSTFAIESVDLLREGRHLAGLANMLASNLTCLLAAYLGLRLGQLFHL